MFHFFGPTAAVLISLGAVLAANAQQLTSPSAPATAARTTAPSAATGDLSYRSAMEGYERFTDEKTGSWREANDEVGRIGGWRQYAREAQGAAPLAGQSPASAASAPLRPAAPAAPGPHSGHSKP